MGVGGPISSAIPAGATQAGKSCVIAPPNGFDVPARVEKEWGVVKRAIPKTSPRIVRETCLRYILFTILS